MIVFPIAAVVHATGVHAHLSVHWWIVLTLIPLACVAMTSLGLLLGTTFEPRNIGLMFGFVVLPLTFLGGTYYQWTQLAPVQVGGFHWLQILVLVNPLIYITEGMRAALTDAPHMHLYVVYPVLIAFCCCSWGWGCGTSGGGGAGVGIFWGSSARVGAKARLVGAGHPVPGDRRGGSTPARATAHDRDSQSVQPRPRTARPARARPRRRRCRAAGARGGEAGGA